MTQTLSPTTRLSRAIERAWDSDLVWKFRHSPPALTSFFVTLALVPAAVFPVQLRRPRNTLRDRRPRP